MSYFEGFGDFLSETITTVGNLSNEASEIKSNWDNFGKTEADLKKEAEEREIKRLAYVAQQNQSAISLTKLSNVSDNQKILIMGAIAIIGIVIFRGK